MPLGLELSGPLFAETSLLGIAHAYEKSTRHAQTHALPAIPHVAAGAPA
jgi:Asp-tRNA(Asn)/Glu-tRNA(Gln) amidotransferase A subunit family amidase